MTNQKQNYKEFIVSTAEHVTFLHRCGKSDLDSVLREGLASWCDDLSGTATAQPRELESAENIYRNGQTYGNAVAVIRFPREIYSRAKKFQALSSKELAYFHPRKKMFTVRPEFVVASIDRETNEVALNPHSDRKPVEGYEAFDFMFD